MSSSMGTLGKRKREGKRRKKKKKEKEKQKCLFKVVCLHSFCWAHFTLNIHIEEEKRKFDVQNSLHFEEKTTLAT